MRIFCLFLVVCTVSACDQPAATPTTSTQDTTVSADVNEGSDATATETSTGGLPLMNPSVAAKAAVYLASCIPDNDVQSQLDAFYTASTVWYDRFGIGAACLATKANGCQAVTDCLGTTIQVPFADCPAVCSGDVLQGCNDGMKLTIDCGKLGLHCTAGPGKPGCVVLAQPTACDYETFEDTCVHGHPVVCASDTVQDGPACEVVGSECAPDMAACKGPGDACEVNQYGSLSVHAAGIACEGGKLNACVAGGMATIDCGKLGKGLTCQEKGGVAFCGVAAECLPGGESSCEGNAVTVCNAGRVEKVDCTALGFTKCLPKYGVCSPGPYDFAK
ncbi:MAG: hypothetical protein ACOYOB_15485 [Myxococcota bacterium]